MSWTSFQQRVVWSDGFQTGSRSKNRESSWPSFHKPIQKCVCGHLFRAEAHIVDNYQDDPEFYALMSLFSDWKVPTLAEVEDWIFSTDASHHNRETTLIGVTHLFWDDNSRILRRSDSEESWDNVDVRLSQLLIDLHNSGTEQQPSLALAQAYCLLRDFESAQSVYEAMNALIPSRIQTLLIAKASRGQREVTVLSGDRQDGVRSGKSA